MNTAHICPDTLFNSQPYGFSQVVVSQGSRVVHIAGQTSQDKDLNVVGEGDLAAQARCAFENVGLALEAAGGKKSDIAKINLFVVGNHPDNLEIIARATQEFFGELPPPASTMVGVTFLALPPFLIEIEATAICD